MVFSITYFIIICCIIIFNEIIILNFCGLDYNTKKWIKQREIKDIETITIFEIISVKGEETLNNNQDSNNIFKKY